MIRRFNLLDLAIPFLALGLVWLANSHPVQAHDPVSTPSVRTR